MSGDRNWECRDGTVITVWRPDAERRGGLSIQPTLEDWHAVHGHGGATSLVEVQP